MSTSKNNFCKLALVFFSFFILSVCAFAADDPAAKLEAGKQLYNQKNYNAAMDNFIDVFVNGNSQQIAEANEYVNMIHFAMGGVDTPKRVTYDPEVEQQRAQQAGQGKELFPAKPQEGEEAGWQQPQPIYEQTAAPVSAAPVNETIIAQEDLSSAEPSALRAMRVDAVNSKINSMTAALIERLNAQNGVSVYTRGGMVDAIDIKADIIFGSGNNFKASGRPVLDDVYALMLLSGTPTFVLLPQGSYTDDVTIQSVRQAVSLNSYFINRGISSGKIAFNMGLTGEEPPAKFSNLEGISIVFDYTAEPNLLRKMADANTPPVLSVGMYPPASIDPAKGEGMLIDFSVIEASSPVADWSLQIIQHNKDGKFYIVRQITGIGAVYKQIFWNGRKQYFGEVLPLGRYTIMLKAKDIDGREKIVRRGVTLTGETVKAAKPAAAAAPKTDGLNYKAARLWKQPSRVQKDAAAAATAAAELGDIAAIAAPAENYDPYAPVPVMDGAAAPALPSGYDAPAPDYSGVNMPYPSQQPAEDEYGY